MFQNLTVFKTAFALARHASGRQVLVAQNIANSDTPGYVPKDFVSFANKAVGKTVSFDPRNSRPGHLHGHSAVTSNDAQTTESFQSANGNAVSLETEMLRSVDAKRQHDKAMAIYRSHLNIIRTSLGRA